MNGELNAASGSSNSPQELRSNNDDDPSSSNSAPPPPSLDKLLTLPFALHLAPLPTLFYQAVPTDPSSRHPSTPSIHDDDSLHNQLRDPTIGSNLKLQPLVITPQPHDIETVSFLLQQSNALQAIRPFAQLIELLNRGDEDPHFKNLIEFFDARYESKTGRLQGTQEEEYEQMAKSNVADQQQPTRKTSVFRRIRTKTGGTQSTAASRKESSVHHRPSVSLGQSATLLKKNGLVITTASGSVARDDSVFEEDDDALDGRSSHLGSEDHQYGGRAFPTSPHSPHSPFTAHLNGHNTRAPRSAPHLVVPSRVNPSETRSIPFTIRLDLHNAGKGLCPPPPLPKVEAWRRLSASGTNSNSSRYTNNGNQVAAVTSPTSPPRNRSISIASHQGPSSAHPADGSGFSSGLRRVISPDSFRSGHSRYSSSDDQGSGSQGLARNASTEKSSTATRATSPTPPAPISPRRRGSTALGRLFTRRKKKGGSSVTADSQPEGASPTESNGLELVETSDLSIDRRGVPSLDIPLATASRRARSPSSAGPNTQDMTFSTDEVGSPHPATSGFSLDPVRENGYDDINYLQDETTALQLVDDDDPRSVEAALVPAVVAEGDKQPSSTTGGPSWAGEDVGDGQGSLPDLMSLFRGASDLALSLPKPVPKVEEEQQGSFSEKALGKQPVTTSEPNRGLKGSGSSSPARPRSRSRPLSPLQGESATPEGLYPPGSPITTRSKRSSVVSIPRLNDEAESQPQYEIQDEMDDNPFTKARLGQTTSEEEPWWPSGGVDPLPVAILSSFSLALGWKGILDLCYGEGSPVTMSGSDGGPLAALGRAVAAARAQEEGGGAESLQGSGLGSTTEALSSATSNQAEESGEPKRTWNDWHNLFLSLSKWIESYEQSRIQNGLSREIGFDPFLSPDSLPLVSQAQYSLTSGTLPSAITSDLSQQANGFRRRMGIPEGLPSNSDLLELGDYRWSRNKLGMESIATSLTLSSSSFVHYLEGLAHGSLTFESGWELDYLEALVLKSPIVAERFPPPISRAVTQPLEVTGQGKEHLNPTIPPMPSVGGSWSSKQWTCFLTQISPSRRQDQPLPTADQVEDSKVLILTPIISLQAWWSIIAIVHTVDEKFDLQILGPMEEWTGLEREDGRVGRVYI